MGYSKEDIIRMVKEEDIKFIRMQFTDIFGQLKKVAITASQIEKAVNNQIMIDGSSIEGFVRINESDQYLWPDLDSFVIFPWRPQHDKVARLICDVYNPDGTPFVGDPRGVLCRVLEKATAVGYDEFNVGPEAEFFLFQTGEDGKPTAKTNDEAGYFDLGPLDHGESTRRQICLALAVCLAAGLDGIEKGMTPPPEITDNIFAMTQPEREAKGIESLPGSLEEALTAMKGDKLVMDTLGAHVASQYIAGKEAEWDEYRTRVSSWEREKYLINY